MFNFYFIILSIYIFCVESITMDTNDKYGFNVISCVNREEKKNAVFSFLFNCFLLLILLTQSYKQFKCNF